MPRGKYTRTPHARISKEELKKFIDFTFRDDIKEQLDKVKRPHQLAVNLYEAETGIKISPQTAYNQIGKWTKINGTLAELKTET